MIKSYTTGAYSQTYNAYQQVGFLSRIVRYFCLWIMTAMQDKITWINHIDYSRQTFYLNLIWCIGLGLKCDPTMQWFIS